MKNPAKIKPSHIYAGVGAVAAIVLATILLGYNGISSTQSNTMDSRDNSIETISASNEAAAQTAPTSTGNLTVYILAVPDGSDAAGAIYGMRDELPFYSTMARSEYGASPSGQITAQEIEITWDNDVDGFAKGEKVNRIVVVKPAETVQFYIDPDVKKPDGSPVTRGDFEEMYPFGGVGSSCCGVMLKDGTRIDAAVLVVDQAYDSQVMEALPNIKNALDTTPQFSGQYNFR